MAAPEAPGKVHFPKKLGPCIYDLVIIGGGPAGLAAAIYGSADGLKTILLDSHAPGGQCGRSSCVENYLGFPDGISGEELADRAVCQARKFGCQFVIPAKVDKVMCGEDGLFTVAYDGFQHLIIARAVIVATGLQLRKLDIPGEVGCANVHYYANMTQGQKYKGQHIHIVGGANSAAQAAMYFSQWAKVTMLIRGDNLSDSMSGYLEERLRANSNITFAFSSRVTRIHGTKRCEKLTISEGSGDQHTDYTEASSALLVYAGSLPQTAFLGDLCARDTQGYVRTGWVFMTGGEQPYMKREPFSLESSCPGLFVAGDVRQGSPKGVTCGIGEGAAAVKQVHNYLSL